MTNTINPFHATAFQAIYIKKISGVKCIRIQENVLKNGRKKLWGLKPLETCQKYGCTFNVNNLKSFAEACKKLDRGMPPQSVSSFEAVEPHP